LRDRSEQEENKLQAGDREGCPGNPDKFRPIHGKHQAMRVDSVICLAILLASLAERPALSQDANHPGSRPQIVSVSVAERADSVDVEVTLSRPVQADISTLEHPDRLVFDFPGSELTHPAQRQVVNRGPVIAVRTAVFSSVPAIARLVIDLRSPLDHEDVYVGNKLVIKLHLSEGPRLPVQAGERKNLATKNQASPPGIDRPPVKSSDDSHPRSSAPTPLGDAGTASVQPTAYVLLARARALSVSDLGPLEARAKAGDPESETVLALAYHGGMLLKRDDAEALGLLHLASMRGFVAAEESMGIFCQLGFGMAPDKAQAVVWYAKAAQHGSRDAATSLALMYSTGDGVQRDVAKAATWFRSSAAAGDATAQLNLASLYHRGEVLPRDDVQAAFWLTKAANQGLLPAMLELASWNLQPEHGNNVDGAIIWFKKASELGDTSAEAALGDIFSDQKLGRVDYAQAVTWYKMAADQGDRAGELGLGTRYLLGQGVPQDLEEARRWLIPAANQGHPYAEFLLGKMFEAGEGGPADAAEARKYYERAANRGVAEAQYRLGLFLAADRSNATSLVSAYKWLVLAEESVKQSSASAQEVRSLLTPPQIAQAEGEIDEWRTEHLPRQSDH
jgi:TPR repeat protein